MKQAKVYLVKGHFNHKVTKAKSHGFARLKQTM